MGAVPISVPAVFLLLLAARECVSVRWQVHTCAPRHAPVHTASLPHVLFRQGRAAFGSSGTGSRAVARVAAVRGDSGWLCGTGVVCVVAYLACHPAPPLARVSYRMTDLLMADFNVDAAAVGHFGSAYYVACE